jgi:hypothetical protein
VTVAKRSLVPVLAAAAAAAAFGFLSWLIAPAHAQDAAKPTPCAGMSFTDPKGDTSLSVSVLDTGVPAPDNHDITGGFFNYLPDESGTPILTANIQVANLTKDVMELATGVSWYFFWDGSDGETYWVAGRVSAAGETAFDYGIVGAGSLETQGETRGKLFEGPDGIIQINVPQRQTKAADGARLATTNASSRATFEIPVTGISFIPTTDDAPDSGIGKTYTVAQCPTASGAAPTPGVTAPTSTTLPVKLVTSSTKASKGKKGKTLSLKVQSTEEVKNLSGALKKGSTSYGSGKLATLNGNGTLKIKLKKALKKGSYKLSASGTTAGGSRKASFAFKVT